MHMRKRSICKCACTACTVETDCIDFYVFCCAAPADVETIKILFLGLPVPVMAVMAGGGSFLIPFSNQMDQLESHKYSLANASDSLLAANQD
jgi:hypothetical protein